MADSAESQQERDRKIELAKKAMSRLQKKRKKSVTAQQQGDDGSQLDLVDTAPTSMSNMDPLPISQKPAPEQPVNATENAVKAVPQPTVSKTSSEALSNDEKLDLARKALSKFQKKRDKSTSKIDVLGANAPASVVLSVPVESVAEVPVTPVRSDAVSANQGKSKFSDLMSSPLKSIVPMPSSPKLNSSPHKAPSETSLYEHQPEHYMRTASVSDVTDDRSGKTVLERIDYLDRLNSLLTKENKSLTLAIKELKEHLSFSDNEVQASQRHADSIEMQLRDLMKQQEEFAQRMTAEKQGLVDANELCKKQLLEAQIALETERQASRQALERVQAAELAGREQAEKQQKTVDDLRQQLQTAISTPSAEFQSKLRDYQMVVDNLRSRNQKLEADLEQSKTLSDQALNFEAENASLKQQVDELTSKNASDKAIADAKLSDFRKELETKISESERLHLDNSEKSRQVEQLSSAIAKESADRQKAKDAADSFKTEVEQLKTKLALMEEALEDKTLQIGMLAGNVEERATSEQDHAEVLQQLNALKGQLELKENSIAAMETEFQAIRTELSEVLSEKQHWIDTLGKAETLAQNLEAQYSEAVQRLKEAADERDLVTDELKMLQEVAVKTNLELEAARLNIKKLETNLAELEQSKAALFDQLQEEISQFSEKEAEKSRSIEELRGQLDEVLANRNELQSQIERFLQEQALSQERSKQELDTLLAKTKSLEATLVEVSNSKTLAEDEARKLHLELEQLSERLYKERVAMEAEKESLRKSNESLSDVVERDLQSAKAKVSDLEASIKVLEADLERAHVERDEATEKTIASEAGLKASSTKLAELTESLSALEALKSKQEEDLHFLRLESETFRQSFEDANFNSQEVIKMKDVEISELLTRLQESEQILLKQQEEVSKAKEQLSQVNLQREALHKQNLEKDSLIQKLTSDDSADFEALQSSVHDIKQKLSEAVDKLNFYKSESDTKELRIQSLFVETTTLQEKLIVIERTSKDVESRTELQLKTSNELAEFILRLKTHEDRLTSTDLGAWTSNDNEQINSLVLMLSHMQHEFRQITLTKLDVEKAYADVSAGYRDVQEKYAQKSVAYEQLQNQLGELRSQRNALDEQLNSMKNTLTQQTVLWEQSKLSLKNKSESLAKSEVDLKEKLAQQQATIDKQAADILKLKKIIDDERKALMEQSEKVQLIRRESLQAVDSARREKESASSSLDMLDTLLRDEKEQNQAQRNTISSLQSSLKEAQTALGDRDELKRMLKSATDELEFSIMSLRTAKDGQKRAESDLGKLKDELEVASQQLQQIVESLPDWTYHGASSSLLGLIEALKEALASKNENQSPTSAMVKRFESLTAPFDGFRFSEMLTELTLSVDNLRQADEQATNELRHHLLSANEQIAKLSHQLEETSEAHQAQLMMKEHLLSAMQEELDALKVSSSETKVTQAEDNLMKYIEASVPTDDHGGYTRDLESSLKKKSTELEEIRERTREFELSLAHAQKTIGTLTDELDRRRDLIEKLEREREQLRRQSFNAQQQQLDFDTQSPVLERQVESVIKRAGETVNVIDELVRLARNKSRSGSSANLVKPQSQPEMLPNDKLAGDKEVLSALLEENEKEIKQLRSALSAITAPPALTASEQAAVDDGDFSTALLQSHIRQLRKVWEHEANANHVLRKLLSEIRQRFVDTERHLQSQIQELQAQLKTSSSVEEDRKRNGESSEKLILELELKTLKEKADRFEVENTRLRSHFQQSASITEELDRVRRDSDSTKVNDLKRAHIAQVDTLKRKYREQQQQLLERFRIKVQEFENAHKTQELVISKLRFEKQHLASKLEVAQQHQFQQQTFNDPGYELLRREILELRNEQKALSQNFRQDRMADSHSAAAQTRIEKKIMEKDAMLLRLTSMLGDNENSLSLSIGNDQKALKRERERHQSHCKALVAEIFSTKLLLKREATHRADLIFQKQYLLMLMGGLEACEKVALTLVSRMGVYTSSTSSHRGDRRNKWSWAWKRAINASLFVSRLKLLRTQWKVNSSMSATTTATC